MDDDIHLPREDDNSLFLPFYPTDICSDRLAGATIISNGRRRRRPITVRRLKKHPQLQPVIRRSTYRPAWETDVGWRAQHPATLSTGKISLHLNLCTALASITIGVCPVRPLPSRPSRWLSTLQLRPSRFDSASPNTRKRENVVLSDSAESIDKPSRVKEHRSVS